LDIHFDCRNQIDVIEMVLRANRFGGHFELVAERPGESFVGARGFHVGVIAAL
jgi:hypothetical protein